MTDNELIYDQELCLEFAKNNCECGKKSKKFVCFRCKVKGEIKHCDFAESILCFNCAHPCVIPDQAMDLNVCTNDFMSKMRALWEKRIL